MTWNDPQYVGPGEASSDQYNEEVVDNLNWLRDSRLLGFNSRTTGDSWGSSENHEVLTVDVTIDASGRLVWIIGHVNSCTGASGLGLQLFDGTTRIQNRAGTGATLEVSGAIHHLWANPSVGVHTLKLVVATTGAGSYTAGAELPAYLAAFDLSAT